MFFNHRYLADESIVIKSEAMLFDLVAKWYAHDQSRSDQLDELLSCIRFSLIPEPQLTQLNAQHWLTSQHPGCRNYLQEGLNFHKACSMGGHPKLDTNARVRATTASLTMVHQGSSYRPFEICAHNVKDGKFYHLYSDTDSARDCRIATIDNFIYICRVMDTGDGSLFNRMFRFDPRHLMMRELAPCSRLRIDPALVSHGQCVYMFGGSREDPFAVHDSVECYDVQRNRWRETVPLPQATHALAATVHKNLIYVSGGMDVHRQPLSTLNVFDPAAQQWTAKSSLQCARRLHVMVTLGDAIYALGGIGTHSFHQQTQIPVERYDPTADQWTVLCSTLAGRSVGHFIALGGQILSIGREHYEATEDDIWNYDLDSDSWSAMVKVPRRVGLATASAVLLHINFNDDQVAKKVLTDRR